MILQSLIIGIQKLYCNLVRKAKHTVYLSVKPLRTVSAVWRKGMTYAKANGVWHITYNSKMDNATNTMVVKTICDEVLRFDQLAQGETEKSDQVCADCEMILRAGDKLLRETFSDKKK